MIINIRGTSGAGKSHLVRSVIAQSEHIAPWWADGGVAGLFGTTGRPAGHLFDTPVGTCLAMGNYDGVQCGGCDQLMKDPWAYSRDVVFEWIRRMALKDIHVLFEGLLIAEVHRCVALKHAGLPIIVLNIDEPIEVCLDAIRARRAARGDMRPLSTTLTVAKHKELHNQVRRLQAAGVDARNVSRAEADRIVNGLLGWH